MKQAKGKMNLDEEEFIKKFIKTHEVKFDGNVGKQILSLGRKGRPKKDDCMKRTKKKKKKDV